MTPETYHTSRLEQAFLNQELSPLTEGGFLSFLEKLRKRLPVIEDYYLHAEKRIEASNGKIAALDELREAIKGDRQILAEISGDLERIKQVFSKLHGKIFAVIPETAAEIERRRIEDIAAREQRRKIVTAPGPDRMARPSSLKPGIL
jgi:hypothetical protein